MKKSVLSCFDGYGGARLALTMAGIEIGDYYSSEIDSKCIKVQNHNFGSTNIHLGDVSRVDASSLYVDILIGGSPCQGFSINGKMLNFEDKRSALFFEFVRLKNESKPEWWLLENVGTMKREIKNAIDIELGVAGIEMNSNLFTAQNRKRIYWTNIPFTLPNFSTTATISDILEPSAEVATKHTLASRIVQRQHFSPTQTDGVITLNPKKADGTQTYQQDRIYDSAGRMVALTSTLGNRFNIRDESGRLRKLTIREQARLQGIPENFDFSCVSDNSASALIGNGFTIPAISYILKYIK